MPFLSRGLYLASLADFGLVAFGYFTGLIMLLFVLVHHSERSVPQSAVARRVLDEGLQVLRHRV